MFKNKILPILVSVLVLVQFIRPAKNNGNADGDADVTHSVTITPEIKSILEKSCYDCHSNHTVYPWYYNFQPVAGWMAHHVDEGKDELNFSEFDTYKLKRKIHKLKEIVEQIKEDEMPMSSYLITHKDAKLSEEQKNKLMQWAEESITILRDTVNSKK